MSFSEKPPILSGNNRQDIANLRDYLFRMARSLDPVANTGNQNLAVRYQNGKQTVVPTGGGGAESADIEQIRRNATELRDLILKTARETQQEIDNIEMRNFFVKYADDFAGDYPGTMYNVPTANTVYMGVCVSTDTTAPTNPALYEWSRVKGNTGPQGPQGQQGVQGDQGIQGPPGPNGQTTYLHIKYSDDGETFTPNQGEDLGAFIGMYTDFTQADSMTFSDYEWHRFADDTELMQAIQNGDTLMRSYVDGKTETYRSMFLAKSEFGTFEETIDTRIATTARGVVESYDFNEKISNIGDDVKDLQEYTTSIDGQIRRGIVRDPTTDQWVTGIAISQDLQFTGLVCDKDDVNNPGDGHVYYYMSEGQTFGLYTSTGWQFWIGGHRKGWYNSQQETLYVENLQVADKLRVGGTWQMKSNGAELEITYVGS